MSSAFEKIHNSKRGQIYYNIHPKSQLVILSIAIFLLWCWYNSIFANPDYNIIALYFGIVTLLWVTTIFIRYMYVGMEIDDYYTNMTDEDYRKNSICLIKVPSELKCFLCNDLCEHGNITYWTVIHVIIYVIAGVIMPNHYLIMFFISILCECIEDGLGISSKFFIDPFFNMLGYWIGNMLSLYFVNLNLSCVRYV